MDIVIHPGLLRGEITVIPSKSLAHRYLICAAFSDGETRLYCPDTSQDMEATASCLRGLGAQILRTEWGYQVIPIRKIPKSAVLNCCESGSTLRFLLPVAGALGVDASFLLSGRLPERPLSPLREEMERMGCRLTRPSRETIRCTGRLKGGAYSIDGGVSSQYITGLLFALSLIPEQTELRITGAVQSRPYIRMTELAMEQFRAPEYRSPGAVNIEGDWSNGAFFLAANLLGSELKILGLNPESPQGDRAAASLLPLLCRERAVISAADIPDLVPILAVTAAASHGAVFTDIQRLRLKESDRVAAVTDMIRSLGGAAESDENTLTVSGGGLLGGVVDSANDHRIAMAAAIAATVCRTNVTIQGAQCVNKSYPRFWEEYRRLGGSYEQYLR